MNGSGDRVIGQTSMICHPERTGAGATASRRIPTTIESENVASGSSHNTLSNLRRCFESAWFIVRSTLSEIFDESAYNRFLLRTRTTRSIESYRIFVREREGAMAKQPRCC